MDGDERLEFPDWDNAMPKKIPVEFTCDGEKIGISKLLQAEIEKAPEHKESVKVKTVIGDYTLKVNLSLN